MSSLFDFILDNYKITKPIRLIEFFAGIGSQLKSLKLLGANVESYKICEWAYNSYIGYNAIHIKDFTDYTKGLSKEQIIEKVKGTSINYNEPLTTEQLNKKPIEWLKNAYNNIVATHNLVNIMNVKGKDLEIVDTDKYDYILTYSFPCQDLSLAGKQQGMAESQANGGTRSGLLWEVERILSELPKEQLPKILLMENVPEVVGTKNVSHFKKWVERLNELGYSSRAEILNAKDYGIPQNRKRCYMISILGEYNYNFLKMDCHNKLKEYLQKEVDEKYYLSKKMIDCFTAEGSEKYKRYEKFESALKCTNDKGTAVSITTRSGSRATDNFVIEDYNNKRLNETLEQNKVEDYDFIDAYNRRVVKDETGTITTRVSDGNDTFIAIKSATKTDNDNGVVVKKDTTNYIEWQEEGKLDLDCRAWKEDGIAPTTTTTTNKTKVLQNDLRIRKFTPIECMRLMAFEDSDTLALYDAGLSNNAIYHVAGDSICVNVLMAIFGKFLLNDNEIENKIIDYVERLKND